MCTSRSGSIFMPASLIGLRVRSNRFQWRPWTWVAPSLSEPTTSWRGSPTSRAVSNGLGWPGAALAQVAGLAGGPRTGPGGAVSHRRDGRRARECAGGEAFPVRDGRPWSCRSRQGRTQPHLCTRDQMVKAQEARGRFPRARRAASEGRGTRWWDLGRPRGGVWQPGKTRSAGTRPRTRGAATGGEAMGCWFAVRYHIQRGRDDRGEGDGQQQARVRAGRRAPSRRARTSHLAAGPRRGKQRSVGGGRRGGGHTVGRPRRPGPSTVPAGGGFSGREGWVRMVCAL